VAARDELQQLPGVGPSIAADLRRLGVRSIRDLAQRDPERLYARLRAPEGRLREVRVPAGGGGGLGTPGPLY